MRVSPGPFRDVVPAYGAFTAITALARRGLVFVRSLHRYEPYAAEARATFVGQVVLMVLSHQPSAAGPAPFRDVPAPLAGAVAFARQHGWLPFVRGDDFRPWSAMTREEAYAVLAEALLGPEAVGAADPGALAGIRDRARLAPWAVRPAAALVGAGYLPSRGYLWPQALLDRGQAAALLLRVLDTLRTYDGMRFRVVRVLPMRATAYGPAIAGVGPYTATGQPVRLGVAAVDPAAIPYGTYLWVSGYGAAPDLPPHGILERAEDTGQLGPDDIDLYLPATSLWPFLAFGVRPVVVALLTRLPDG